MGLGKLGRSDAAPVREYVEERFLAQKVPGSRISKMLGTFECGLNLNPHPLKAEGAASKCRWCLRRRLGHGFVGAKCGWRDGQVGLRRAAARVCADL
jgi:hypothetical protein